jgi:hypothetical protein
MSDRLLRFVVSAPGGHVELTFPAASVTPERQQKIDAVFTAFTALVQTFNRGDVRSLDAHRLTERGRA